MVSQVRGGTAARAVARSFGVALSVVQYWLRRAQKDRLDRVCWDDRPVGCRTPANRSSAGMEDRVLELRKHLREKPSSPANSISLRRRQGRTARPTSQAIR